jgi:hypothetical protein
MVGPESRGPLYTVLRAVPVVYAQLFPLTGGSSRARRRRAPRPWHEPLAGPLSRAYAPSVTRRRWRRPIAMGLRSFKLIPGNHRPASTDP